MKVTNIYENYKIMPQLQLHMFRVAGVASIICDNFKEEVDKESIIAACLIHDIGNIVKFDLRKFPQDLKPEGYEYWRKVQDDYFEKYGKDDHQATYKILKELGISKRLLNLINTMELRKASENVKKKGFEIKITQYADMRDSPTGVTSMEERLREAQERFMRNKGVNTGLFNKYKSSMQEIEIQIFEKCKVKPSYITNETVQPMLESLREFEIQTKVN